MSFIIALRLVLHHFRALSYYISETESTQSVVQIVGIASYISVETELLGRQEVEQRDRAKTRSPRKPSEVVGVIPRSPTEAKESVPKHLKAKERKERKRQMFKSCQTSATSRK